MESSLSSITSKNKQSFKVPQLSPPKNPYLLLTHRTLDTTSTPSKFNRISYKKQKNDDSPQLMSRMKTYLREPSEKKKTHIIITQDEILKEKQKQLKGKNQFVYKPFYCRDYSRGNKDFNNDFIDYLNGTIEISEFINRNNFPHERDFSLKPNIERSRNNSYVNFSPQIKIKNEQKNVKSFEGLRKIIREKIKLRKQQNFSTNRNFEILKQFSNISEDYIKKIQNSDLLSENFDKKYYIREKEVQKNLNSCRMIKENLSKSLNLLLD